MVTDGIFGCFLCALRNPSKQTYKVINKKESENQMKITRTVKVIAIILALTMLPLWMLGCGNVSGKVSDRLVDAMVGDKSLKKKYDSTVSFVERLDAEAKYAYDTFEDGGWKPEHITDGDSVRIHHYRNIYKMTLAWATKGSSLYHKGSVLKTVKEALKYGTESLYGANEINIGFFDLTLFERTEIADLLVRSLLILSDSHKLSKKTCEKYLEIVDVKFTEPIGDAVDLVRTSYVCIASAAIQKDNAKIRDVVSNYLVKALGVVTDGNGLYADGSYKAYTETASTGSYGVFAFSTLVEIVNAVNGTKAKLSAELNVNEFLYSWAVNSIIPTLQNGTPAPGTTGSYLGDSDRLGGTAVSALLLLADMVGGEKAAYIKSVVKGYSEAKFANFVPYLTSYGACEYQDVVKSKKITALKDLGAHSFAQNDKLVVNGQKFGVALSLSSFRSAKYETKPIYVKELEELYGAINGNGWYTGDGMLTIYSDDYKTNNNYWEFVNRQRIPGTTTDSRTRTAVHGNTFDGATSNAGFAVLGSFAVSANDFINNNSELASDLRAKKSVFIFDNEIVALGAGITNTVSDTGVTGTDIHTIETIVENIFYNNSNLLMSSPEEKDDILLSFNKEVEINKDFIWAMRYGGIYIPSAKNDTLKAKLLNTQGGNFVEIWLDHGSKPTDATYEYAILPSASTNMNEFFAYVADPGYEVLSNTAALQAVKDKSSGAVGYTFWKGGEVNGIKTDFACNVLTKVDGNTVTIAIADFTHSGAGNQTGGTITLSGDYSGYNNVTSTVNGLSFANGVITVDRAIAASGTTLTITLSK